MPLYEIERVQTISVTYRVKADSKDVAVTRVECGSAPGSTGVIQKRSDESFEVTYTVSTVEEHVIENPIDKG